MALAVEVGAGDGVLSLGLREGADAFRARLAGPGEGGASLYHNLGGGQVADAAGFPGLVPGQRVLFWNVDNAVRLWVDGELVLAYDYAANTSQPPGATLVNTPELRFACPEDRKWAVVDEVRQRLAAAGDEVTDIDGVRVKTADGWWLLRASNTEDALTLRCEAADAAGLKALTGRLARELRASGLEPPAF